MEFKLNKSDETFSLFFLWNVEGHCLLLVISLEVYNSVFEMQEADKKIPILPQVNTLKLKPMRKRKKMFNLRNKPWNKIITAQFESKGNKKRKLGWRLLLNFSISSY